MSLVVSGTGKRAAAAATAYLHAKTGESPFAAWLNFVQLGLGLHARVGPLSAHGVVSVTLRLVLLSVAVGGAAFGAYAGLATAWPGEGTAIDLARLLLSAGAGLAVWAAGLAWMRLPEAEALVRRLRR